MLLPYPKEIKKLMDIYEPYMEGCHLVEDAPQEAVEALEKVKKWAFEQGQ
jgi:hypothetical protein